MAQINKPDLYFNTKLYTGNGGTNAVTGVGFSPSFTWIKERSSTSSHFLADTIRGATKIIYSDRTQAEETVVNAITSFDSDGFTNGADNGVNENSQTYASWNWLANGAGSANTDGSISSTVSSSATSGFSIVSYTGTNATGTVGHGLGSTPKVVIYKNRTDVTNWYFTTTVIDGSNDLLFLNTTEASQTFSAPVATNSLLNLIANNDTNGSGDNIIAYCFAEKQGYSKFGSYTGTSSEVFIYTGFKPRFILIKKTSEAASWHLFDTSRTVSNGGNQLNKILFPNLSNAEVDDAYNYVDAYSNGFRCFSGPSGQGTETNKNGQTFIYMAFAEQPLVGTNNIPATAR